MFNRPNRAFESSKCKEMAPHFDALGLAELA
jgi:hypothetical protein